MCIRDHFNIVLTWRAPIIGVVLARVKVVVYYRFVCSTEFLHRSILTEISAHVLVAT
jgi:hypothetical protein